MNAPSPLYPLFLLLGGRTVVVLGAGAVAERKIEELIGAGAKVRVVAPEATDRVRALAAGSAVTWERRAFASSDLDGAWLVVSATGDAEVQRRIFQEAEARHVFVLAVDDLPHGSAYGGAIIRRPPFIVSISSSAEAPGLTRLLREVIEQALPDERWVAAARTLRARWKKDKTPMASRFPELLREFTKMDRSDG